MVRILGEVMRSLLLLLLGWEEERERGVGDTKPSWNTSLRLVGPALLLPGLKGLELWWDMGCRSSS